MSTLSKQLTNILTKEEHKSDGIYFTPPDDVKYIVEKVFKFKKDITDILEPSCGSCEFIRYIDKEYKQVNVDGYEINKTIFKHIKDLQFRNKVSLHNKDFLKSSIKKKYDLIIGNPPYYETKTGVELSKYFNTQKINIYLLFIVKSLKLLKRNGILAFVLPNNFLNNKYCNEFRKCIKENYKVKLIHLFDQSQYLNTSQTTSLIILENVKPRERYVEPRERYVKSWDKYSIQISDALFYNTSANIKILNLNKSDINLDQLGFSVKVGNVLWNEHKDKLSSKQGKDYIRLIYNTDIVNGKIISPNDHASKKAYIKIDKEPQKGPVLVVNRGHGTGKYKFEYAIYDSLTPVLFENHVLIITPPYNKKKEIMKKHLEMIKKSFDDERTSLFINTIFTNNAINVYEMKYIVPIYRQYIGLKSNAGF